MPFEALRAGSPFSGKFVLFKPVLFVQVVPAGSEDAGTWRGAGRFRLTSRLEREITGSMLGAGISRGSHRGPTRSNNGKSSASFLFLVLFLSLPLHLEAFLALLPLRLFENSRLEDVITGSTIDVRASRGSHHGLDRFHGR